MFISKLNSNLGEVKVTDNVYNSIAAGGATSIYGKTIEATKGTDTYYLTANAEKELLVGFRSTPSAAITWKKYVSNTDLSKYVPKKNYIEARVSTKANEHVEISASTIVGGAVPPNRNYIPVVVGHSLDNKCNNYIFSDSNRWYIRSDMAQIVTILFYRMD